MLHRGATGCGDLGSESVRGPSSLRGSTRSQGGGAPRVRMVVAASRLGYRGTGSGTPRPRPDLDLERVGQRCARARAEPVLRVQAVARYDHERREGRGGDRLALHATPRRAGVAAWTRPQRYGAPMHSVPIWPWGPMTRRARTALRPIREIPIWLGLTAVPMTSTVDAPGGSPIRRWRKLQRGTCHLPTSRFKYSHG